MPGRKRGNLDRVALQRGGTTCRGEGPYHASCPGQNSSDRLHVGGTRPTHSVRPYRALKACREDARAAPGMYRDCPGRDTGGGLALEGQRLQIPSRAHTGDRVVPMLRSIMTWSTGASVALPIG